MVGHRSAVALLFAASALLAGCAGDSPATDASDTDTEGAGAGAGALQGGNGSVAIAPAWEVGQSWTHEWTIGAGTAFTVKSIVAENTSSDYLLATDDEETAGLAAAFFFPDIGRMSKSDWTVRDGDYAFPWYNFPLEDGKTWSATEQNLGFDLGPVTRSLQLRAVSAGDGRFTIEATENGVPRARYDYDPTLEWFSKYESLSQSEDGATVTDFSIITVSSASGFTGTYYQAAGDFLLNYFALVVPTTGQVLVEPTKSFSITSTHTHVMAILFNFAVAGGGHIQLLAPDGRHWESNAISDADGASIAGSDGVQVFVPAVVGDWRVAWVGASPLAAGGGAFAWGLTVTSASL